MTHKEENVGVKATAEGLYYDKIHWTMGTGRRRKKESKANGRIVETTKLCNKKINKQGLAW